MRRCQWPDLWPAQAMVLPLPQQHCSSQPTNQRNICTDDWCFLWYRPQRYLNVDPHLFYINLQIHCRTRTPYTLLHTHNNNNNLHYKYINYTSIYIWINKIGENMWVARVQIIRRWDVGFLFQSMDTRLRDVEWVKWNLGGRQWLSTVNFQRIATIRRSQWLLGHWYEHWNSFQFCARRPAWLKLKGGK